ncbi:MAG: DNA topoisomerase 3 [Sporolactobacillus sp.]
MKKALVLTEKPSVARDIAAVLGCSKTNRHFFEGDRYVITWALGHLIELKMPEDYHAAYQTWRLEDLPIMPQHMETKPIKQTRAQLSAIQHLSARLDLNELIIATDAGREGELVARWIIAYIGWQKPLKRLWVSSQTDRAIRDGFAHLKEAAAFNRLYESAVCRAQADWLVGLNVSRALTVKYNDSLSAGRVQTPTLAMILERGKQIAAFRPQSYWTINAATLAGMLTWHNGSKTRIDSEQQAYAILERLSDQHAVVTALKTVRQTETQPLPFDLTELQRAANRQLGFSAKKTLTILQNLYEHHKIVTYPRTDSRYLTADIEGTMAERLAAIAPAFGFVTRRLIHGGSRVLARHVFNDQKVSDHHALIPTEKPVCLRELSTEERALYELIVRRFLTLFYDDYCYDSVHAELDAAGEQLTIASTIVIHPGFRTLTDEELSAQDHGSFSFALGDRLHLDKVHINEKMTEPPALFSEADLLAQMKKFDLGTSATRAEIIERLLQSQLIERVGGGRLRASEKGRQLIALVEPELRSPQLTAEWEHELENIARGSGHAQRFMDHIRTQTSALVEAIRTSTRDYRIANMTELICPDCGEHLREVRDRDGARILVCSSRTCNYRRRKDPKLANHRCAHCHKKMEIHQGKNGFYLQCRTCGIVEKMDKGAKRADKRETRQLLQKLNDDQPFASNLADALRSALKSQK